MEWVLVSRQPIYRADLSELGYELLFRNSDKDAALFSDGDQATAEVIVNTFMEIGLDEMVGRHLAFINFDRNLIFGNYWECLPRERVVLEILSNPDVDMKDLEQAISQDVSLSYKLLRFINSAMFCLERTVSSIRHAITLLGQENIRRWASLIL